MIPSAFLERLQMIAGADDYSAIVQSFSTDESFAFRINPLKGDPCEIVTQLHAQGVSLSPVPWCLHAYLVGAASVPLMVRHPLFDQGRIYRQSLSSMIPAVLLGVLPGDRVLDACAAPGSKATQMAGMMLNEGEVVAVEAVKARFFRLRSVCSLLGAVSVVCKLCDVRRLRLPDGGLFDRVLVDAPCSSEGRFRADEPDSHAYWSPRKIKEMSYKQKGILMSAARLLKPGGCLVYATCTFAPEENEEVVDWFLKKSAGAFVMEDAGIPGVPRLPCLERWGRDVFSSPMAGCLRVRPQDGFTGFFVAKLRKI